MKYPMTWTSLIVMIAPSDFMKLMDFNEILDYQGFPLISTTVVRYKASDKKKLKILRSEKIIFEFLVRNHPETTQNSPSCQIQHPPNTTSEPAAEIEKSVYILQNTEMVILKARQGSRPGTAGGCDWRQGVHDRVA